MQTYYQGQMKSAPRLVELYDMRKMNQTVTLATKKNIF